MTLVPLSHSIIIVITMIKYRTLPIVSFMSQWQLNYTLREINYMWTQRTVEISDQRIISQFLLDIWRRGYSMCLSTCKKTYICSLFNIGLQGTKSSWLIWVATPLMKICNILVKICVLLMIGDRKNVDECVHGSTMYHWDLCRVGC